MNYYQCVRPRRSFYMEFLINFQILLYNCIWAEKKIIYQKFFAFQQHERCWAIKKPRGELINLITIKKMSRCRAIDFCFFQKLPRALFDHPEKPRQRVTRLMPRDSRLMIGLAATRVTFCPEPKKSEVPQLESVVSLVFRKTSRNISGWKFQDTDNLIISGKRLRTTWNYWNTKRKRKFQQKKIIFF